MALEFRHSFYYLVAMSDTFPADVKEFLGQNIHSVAQLPRAKLLEIPIALELPHSFYYLAAMGDAFPADVKEFLGVHIQSVAQLEVLLMLRAEPERRWSADDVAKILYVQPPMAKGMLMNLVQRGFVVQEEASFRYQPSSDEVGVLLERVAQLYQERRVAVTYEIYSKPMNVVQAFADAFRLRKEE